MRFRKNGRRPHLIFLLIPHGAVSKTSPIEKWAWHECSGEVERCVIQMRLSKRTHSGGKVLCYGQESMH
jgi:hypothetical protein